MVLASFGVSCAELITTNVNVRLRENMCVMEGIYLPVKRFSTVIIMM